MRREMNGNVEWRPFALTWSQIGDIFVENTLKIADAAGGNVGKYGDLLTFRMMKENCTISHL